MIKHYKIVCNRFQQSQNDVKYSSFLEQALESARQYQVLISCYVAGSHNLRQTSHKLTYLLLLSLLKLLTMSSQCIINLLESIFNVCD